VECDWEWLCDSWSQQSHQLRQGKQAR
jgi:hypothetical protein